MWFLYFIKEFIAVPAFLVGIFTLFGGLAQRKKASKVVISVTKVIIGFLIMGGGAGVLVGSLSAFQPVFKSTYGMSGVIPNNDALAGAMAGALPKIVSLGSVIMVVSMLFNIGLAITSRHKYVYLSGHVLYYMSLMLATVMYTIGMDFQNDAGDYAMAVFSGSFLLAAYMVISPALQQRYMKQIVGTDEIAMGHTGGFGYALSGFIGEMIGKAKKGKVLSTEEIKFPQGLYFFRNTMVSISITVMIFYMFAFIPGGILYEMDSERILNSKEAVDVLSNGNWLVTMFVQAFTFTAGVEIILAGVRLFIGELVPMFKGVSEKIVKNSKAAVDCPVVFPYAPNAVLIGFISSFLAGIVGMAITIGLNSGGYLLAIILPGLVPHFFLGATSGVFGNVKGGILGAIIGPAIQGLIITFIPAIFIWGGWVPLGNSDLTQMAIDSGEKPGAIESLNWGDTDYVIGAFVGLFGLISKYAVLGVSLALYVGLVLDGFIARFKGWGPYKKEKAATPAPAKVKA